MHSNNKTQTYVNLGVSRKLLMKVDIFFGDIKGNKINLISRAKDNILMWIKPKFCRLLSRLLNLWRHKINLFLTKGPRVTCLGSHGYTVSSETGFHLKFMLG
jgi:hypothetical protein